MSKFMVNVVLHKRDESRRYDGLNTAMAKRGFTRELAGKRASYHLPLGSYWYEGDISTNELRLLAAGAAETTGEDFGIVVVRSDGWSVMKLKKVEAAPQG